MRVTAYTASCILRTREPRAARYIVPEERGICRPKKSVPSVADSNNSEPSPRTIGTAIFASPRTAFGDRKSTRLNSSHVEISYAVFCLKKKKNYKRTMVDNKNRKCYK